MGWVCALEQKFKRLKEFWQHSKNEASSLRDGANDNSDNNADDGGSDDNGTCVT